MITLYTTIAIAISILISLLVGRMWIKASKQKDFLLNAEALRNPINTSITVSGFILPIIVGIITFSFGKNETIVNKDYFLFSSIILIILSIFFGLWNNYSLATLTSEDGKFPITKDDNTTFPAVFVFQLSLLFFGIIFLGMFGLCNMNPKVVTIAGDIKPDSVNNYSTYILKPLIQVNTHKNLLIDQWGEPNEIKNSDSLKIYIYSSYKSDFNFTIKNDTIINVNEKFKQ